MYLRLVDKLIKQGDYTAALDAVTKARRHDPQNRYAIAIEARVRTLIDEAEKAKRTGQPMPVQPPRQELRNPVAPSDGLPSVEGQLNAIATPLPPPAPQYEERTESKHLAILSKVASLLGTANDYLEKHEYERALEVVSRAALLDPSNADIRTIEQRIRSAREDSRKRELEEQERRAAADRLRREHLLQEELARVQREQDDRRRTEEAERKRAQQQKAMQVLQRARVFVTAGQIQEAQCELAYLSVLDPENPEVIALEREISRRREDQHRAELEAYRQQLEEQRRREQAVRDEIANTVREADRLASQEKFSEALRTVTRGYILDPTNSDLQACENRVASAQSEWTARVQLERQEQQEALRKKLEEEEQRRKVEERERLLRAEEERQEEQKREKQQQIVRHLRKAHEYLAATQFKEAREEVAGAFLVDPFSEDVAILERRISEEQARAAQPRPEPPPPASTPEDVELEAVEAVIARTLADAKRFAAEGKFEQALQETALAVALDPANDMIRRIEAGIRRDWDEQRRLARESRKNESQNKESQKTEPLKTGSQKTEPPKTGSQKIDSQKTDSQKTDSQKINSQKTDSHKIDSQRTESQRDAYEKAATSRPAVPREEMRGEESYKAERLKFETQIRRELTSKPAPQKSEERNVEPLRLVPQTPEPGELTAAPSGTEEGRELPEQFAGWRRRAIIAAAILSALLLALFYKLTPPVVEFRAPGPGTTTQATNPQVENGIR